MNTYFFKKIIIGLKNPIDALFYIFNITRCYSQTGEDLILKHLIHKNNGFYIDLGANHPIRYNNTYYFYTKGWTGINVEPNKYLINKFYKKRPKDKNLKIAAGVGDKLTFYLFDPNTLSTCDYETSEKYKKLGHKLIEQYSVPVMGLKEIIEKYGNGKEIDILSIDVEGYDLEILNSNDWEKYKPKYVILETAEYSKDGTGKKLNYIYDSLFNGWGYEKIADTYINTIYKLK